MGARLRISASCCVWARRWRWTTMDPAEAARWRHQYHARSTQGEKEETRVLRADGPGQPLAERLVVDYRREAGRGEDSVGMTYASRNESAANRIISREEKRRTLDSVSRSATAAEEDSKERRGHEYMNCRTGGGEKRERREKNRKGDFRFGPSGSKLWRSTSVFAVMRCDPVKRTGRLN
ncbi:hypothetical protein DFH09DRAFT_1099557 [Mycena vulgaris]|nr:hypothetical protein DFH09DRAFT_1099557 [Mycena vulgaris]